MGVDLPHLGQVTIFAISIKRYYQVGLMSMVAKCGRLATRKRREAWPLLQVLPLGKDAGIPYVNCDVIARSPFLKGDEAISGVGVGKNR